ncbi:hypothetical protein [Nocardiopsis baichengensis]|uniref:hypothetical protein n=1 Tax=Nocardiopsis baichengensis TaxID=280240 RepID=UPI00034A17E1|nr:hypothetical protein [Nocardiopsis baichengensis]
MQLLPSPGTLTDTRTGDVRVLRPVLLEDDADLLRLTGDTAAAEAEGRCTTCFHPLDGHTPAGDGQLVLTCP